MTRLDRICSLQLGTGSKRHDASRALHGASAILVPFKGMGMSPLAIQGKHSTRSSSIPQTDSAYTVVGQHITVPL